MDRATLQARIAELPFWYHKIALPHGIVTPGFNPHFPAKYRVPADLTGKRVWAHVLGRPDNEWG